MKEPVFSAHKSHSILFAEKRIPLRDLSYASWTDENASALRSIVIEGQTLRVRHITDTRSVSSPLRSTERAVKAVASLMEKKHDGWATSWTVFVGELERESILSSDAAALLINFHPDSQGDLLDLSID